MYGAESYSRSLDIAPVRLSYPYLMGLIGKIRSLTETANANADSRFRGTETLDVTDGRITLSLERGFSLDDFRRAPPVSFSVHYSFVRTDAPISRVELHLDDYGRTLLVGGSAADQVDALIAAFSQQVAEFTVMFGGSTFRIVISAILFVMAFVFTPWVGIWVGGGGATEMSRVVRGFSTVVIFGLAIQLFIWLGPWQKLFPGTAVYAGDASFFVQNAPLFTFVGTVIGIGTVIAATLRALLRRLRSSPHT